jgi:hypothetical protein
VSAAPPPLGDADFIAAFESCTLPAAQFHHRDHVRLAFLYLRRHSPLEALARFTTGLQRYAATLGATTLYHETITWAYLLLIHERMQHDRTQHERMQHDRTQHERMQRDPGGDFETFAQDHADLFARQPSVLERYYLPETLTSELARRTFLFPDAR